MLEAVQEHYFQSDRTPDINSSYDRHLEKLIKFNEHVLLKFEEKVKPGSWRADSVEEENDEFIKHARNGNNDDGSLRLFIVAAAIYDYGHQTIRSDRLVERTDADDPEQAALVE